jgi:lincosamide nucleotidyltransferase A/C/D/E
MTSADVVEALGALERYGCPVWIDGGWGVDALVGEQTRDHTDLDLAVNLDELTNVEHALAEIGYRHDRTVEPGLPARLVLRDDRGRQIDIHPLLFDEDGHGWQQLSDTGRAWARYPAEHLRATGSIAGVRVRCLSPELQVRFRAGYEWSSRDEHDIDVVARRFPDAPMPPPFWNRS